MTRRIVSAVTVCCTAVAVTAAAQWLDYRTPGHLDVAMTFDDSKSYNKPFTVNVTHLLQADSDILEYVCSENEKDRAHMVK